MQAKIFWKPELVKEGDCQICEVYRQAYDAADLFNRAECPVCHEYFFDENCDYKIVGPDNSIPHFGEENYINCRIFTCEKCRSTIALIPQKIVYNANHDIYYTNNIILKPIIDDLINSAQQENVNKEHMLRVLTKLKHDLEERGVSYV